MQKIFITGAGGFVGTNLRSYLSEQYQFVAYLRGEKPIIREEIVIHLAGKAHDTKNVSRPEEFYHVNTELTKQVFDAFLLSPARVFIMLSSVKAAADSTEGVLTEDVIPKPTTHYGKSKLLAEQYILSRPIPPGKRVYILRPSMIHGPGNKGNLNLLYQVVRKNLPWPLAAFHNQRSFCSIENLCFVIKELIHREDVPSGIYHIADDEALSTNDLIRGMAKSMSRRPRFIFVPVHFVKLLARMGDMVRLPLNSERLQKLTESYVVDNKKIKTAIRKPFPVSAEEGFMRTFYSFGKSTDARGK
jgi:nucleoside-diphosphate-sugar epimerase